MKRNGYIYKYLFPNGKVYIGQTTTSVEQRHYVHMSDARRKGRGTLCDVALAKFGEIKPETIEVIEDEDNVKLKLRLNEAEKKWINHYDSAKIANGYNVQHGGKITSEDDMILEEKWYEIFVKEKWEELLSYLHYHLENIGNKTYLTKEKLDKDERYVWYGYRFDCDIKNNISFSEYYRTYKPSKNEESLESYRKFVLEWAWNEFIEDVQCTIWRQVDKNKEKYIKEYWLDAKIKRI